MDSIKLLWNFTQTFFFFSSRRRHTRLTCDWSSDVCSSDLSFYKASAKVPESPYPPALASAPSAVVAGRPTALMLSASNWNRPEQIGRASCRERVKILVAAVARNIKYDG